MKVCFDHNGRIGGIHCDGFYVPFAPDTYGFFVETQGAAMGVELIARGGCVSRVSC